MLIAFWRASSQNSQPRRCRAERSPPEAWARLRSSDHESPFQRCMIRFAFSGLPAPLSHNEKHLSLSFGDSASLRWMDEFGIHPSHSIKIRKRRCCKLREPYPCRMMVLVRWFLPSTYPLKMRVGKKRKKARISAFQLRKAERALRMSSEAVSRTRLIQASSCASAVCTVASAYHVRPSSLSFQAVSS